LEDNIRMDLWEVEWECVDWIHLAQDSEKWRAFVSEERKERYYCLKAVMEGELDQCFRKT